MKIRIQTGTVSESKAESVIISLFEKEKITEEAAKLLDEILDGNITRLIESGQVTGKLNQITSLYTLGKCPASMAVIIGLGKRAELTSDRIRGAFAEACRMLEQKNITTAAVAAINHSGISPDIVSQSITEGAILGTYAFRRHLTKASEHKKINTLTIIPPENTQKAQMEAGRKKGEILAAAVIRARDMVNEPANFMTPSDMAEIAKNTASEHGLSIEVLERPQMADLGMGGLLGVSAGTEQPPKLMVLTYNGGTGGVPDIALVGKAITFDSGGISIKPSAGMEDMKGDMSGGAAVIAAMGAIAQLKPAVNVTGIIPATENLPSGKALKPGDVITAMGGKTIEIISTDAEGRLILADAIGYARKLKAKRIVDIATLTGAMASTLGDICFGAFPNNQALADSVIAAGAEAGERIWQMPMFDDYKELNKSEVADIKNTGGRYAGSITAAHFLGEFVGDVPWVHLDIAGVFLSDKTKNYTVKGATGIPVRTLVNLVMSLKKS